MLSFILLCCILAAKAFLYRRPLVDGVLPYTVVILGMTWNHFWRPTTIATTSTTSVGTRRSSSPSSLTVETQNAPSKRSSTSTSSSPVSASTPASTSSPSPVRKTREGSNQRKEDRINAVLDVIREEESYTGELEYVMNHFKIPIEQNIKTSESKNLIMTRENFKELFSNIEMIYNVHKTLLSKIYSAINYSGNDSIGDKRPNLDQEQLKNISQASLGSVFSKMAPSFKLYIGYMKDYLRTQELLEMERENNPSFRSFAKQHQRNDTSLEHFLSLPLRRIPVYIKQLKYLLQATPTSHADHSLVSRAIEQFEEIAVYNEEKRIEIQQREKVIEIQNKLGLKTLVQAKREFLYSGTLERRKKNGSKFVQHDAYLFHDILVLSRNKSFLGMSSLSHRIYNLSPGFTVHAIPFSKKNLYSFYIRDFDDTLLFLRCSTESDRHDWLRHLRMALEPKFFSSEMERCIQDSITEAVGVDDDPQGYYRTPLRELWEDDQMTEWKRFMMKDDSDVIRYSEIEDNNNSNNNNNNNCNSNVEDQHENKNRRIRSATLDKLIERLTSPQHFDNNFLFAFMLTYASFTDSTTLIRKLRSRYNTPPSKESDFQSFKREFLYPVRLRIVHVVMHLIKHHSYRIVSDGIENDLRDFIQEIRETKMKIAANDLLYALDKSKNEKTSLVSAFNQNVSTPRQQVELKSLSDETSPVKSPSSSSKSSSKSFFGLRTLSSSSSSSSYNNENDDIILRYPIIDIARQLSLIEFELFSRIQPRECLNQAWNKTNRETQAPNIFGMIRRTNKFIYWLSMEILQFDSAKIRSRAIVKFIQVGEECRKLGNFNAVLEIVGGLNSVAIGRLKQSWAGVANKYKDLFRQLEKLVDQTSSCKNMRKALKASSPPCIPYIGMYLTDLTFIEDGNQDYLDGLINFSKRRHVAGVISEITSLQSAQYTFAIVADLFQKLFHLELPQGAEDNDVEEFLYQKSIQREPRK